VRGSGYGPFNSTILAFACKETRTRTKNGTKTKSITKEKTFSQNSLPLNQNLNLLFTYVRTYTFTNSLNGTETFLRN